MSVDGLGRLTRGERLLVDRRRRGENQTEAGKRFYLSRFNYGEYERDERHLPPGYIEGYRPIPKIGRLKAHERCFLYRRRVGETQEQVAAGMGRSRFWVHQMETGVVPCDELLWYWEA